MKNLKKTEVDFAGCFEDESRRKGSRLFPVDFDDSDSGAFNKYRKKRTVVAGEKQKPKSGPSESININSPKPKLIKHLIERIQRHLGENPGWLNRIYSIEKAPPNGD
jgi:hypothetical protein